MAILAVLALVAGSFTLVDLATHPSISLAIRALVIVGLGILLSPAGEGMNTTVTMFGIPGLVGLLIRPTGGTTLSSSAAAWYWSYLLLAIGALVYYRRSGIAKGEGADGVTRQALPEARAIGAAGSWPLLHDDAHRDPMDRTQSTGFAMFTTIALSLVTALFTLIGVRALVASASGFDLSRGLSLVLVPCASLLFRAPLRAALLGAWLAGGGVIGLATLTHRHPLNSSAPAL